MKKEDALKKVENEYYDRNSPHYLDNQRFRWVLETINKRFDSKDLDTMDF